jgi:phospholipid N-methyltransferase
MAETLACYLRFFWAGLVKQGQTGAIVPSQRFLISKMIAPVPADYTGQVVELGSGTGVITVALARRCPRARILACEINPALAQITRDNLNAVGVNGRAKIVIDSAEHVLSEWCRTGRPKPDYIISAIPLGNLGKRKARTLIEIINKALARDGTYVQFQYSLLDRRKVRASFPKMRTVPAFLNFPPAFVYYARR